MAPFCVIGTHSMALKHLKMVTQNGVGTWARSKWSHVTSLIIKRAPQRMVKTKNKRRFAARNQSSATSPTKEQYGVPDIAWNVLLLKMAPLKTWSPLSCAFAQETQATMGPEPSKFFTKILKFCRKDVMRSTYRFFTIHSWQNLRVYWKASVPRAQFQKCHSSVCTASRLQHPCVHAQPRQLHPCMQVSRQLNPFV
jgi:hypothetical protein